MSIDNSTGEERKAKLTRMTDALKEWDKYLAPILARDPGLKQPFDAFKKAVNERAEQVSDNPKAK